MTRNTDAEKAEFAAHKIRGAIYRPFTKCVLFYDSIRNEKPRLFPKIFPTPAAERENRAIVTSVIGYRAATFSALMANCIPDLHLCAALDGHQCFPLYTYFPNGTHRRDNITDWALARFREHYQHAGITKTQIFHYVYALLHHPDYRARFADNLKRELPRIPFAPHFDAFADAGFRLARLHLDYEQLEPYPLEFFVNPGFSLSYRVEDKMRLAKDKRSLVVNPSLTLASRPTASNTASATAAPSNG